MRFAAPVHARHRSWNIPYTDSIEHVFDELYLIDILLRIYLEKYKKDDIGNVNKFHGLYIDEAEIEAITS
ncbi:MAG: hypothetical protein JW795_17010, partial [Chitinivibrionales bacterium]|nr:hypothetical protein [Chitinivibrionales bacterium]